MTQQHFIPSKSAIALKIKKGQKVKVIDVEGQQVADFVAYNAEDFNEFLDSAATMDALHSKEIKQYENLYSNLYRPMLTIVKDEVNKHDFLIPACRPEMFELLYNNGQNHKNCFDNLNQVLSSFGIPNQKQHYPFNIFMNTRVSANGDISINVPLSKAGDYLQMKAEMDLVIAISACPTKESACNGYIPTPIRVEINQ